MVSYLHPKKIWQVSLVPLLIASLAAGCGKKESKEEEESTTTTTSGTPTSGGGPTEEEGGIPVTGTLAFGAALQGDSTVTHVVALNSSSGEAYSVEVQEDGSFAINIEADKPWVISYIDSTQVGPDMIVSRFVSDTLDTLNATDSTTEISMGEVDVALTEATTTASHDDLLAATGMSAEAATEFGAVDDVSLRYLNPDIDGNGKLDAVEGISYGLDFHNRFTAKTAAGESIQIADLKNAFPPDDTVYEFTGSGIIPWFSASLLDGTNEYSWTFSSDATTGTNGGQGCDGIEADSLLQAGTACNLKLDAGQSVQEMPGIELAAAVDGTYTLVNGTKTFTWTNVKVSDFSAGEGFVALFTKYDVDDSESLQSVSYKWMRKNADGVYELATEEYLKLVVKDAQGYISLKVDGMNSGKGIGVKIPGTPEGIVTLSDTALVHAEGFDESEMRDGISWTRCLENPGISYDDKLGMRFFF